MFLRNEHNSRMSLSEDKSPYLECYHVNLSLPQASHYLPCNVNMDCVGCSSIKLMADDGETFLPCKNKEFSLPENIPSLMPTSNSFYSIDIH